MHSLCASFLKGARVWHVLFGQGSLSSLLSTSSLSSLGSSTSKNYQEHQEPFKIFSNSRVIVCQVREFIPPWCEHTNLGPRSFLHCRTRSFLHPAKWPNRRKSLKDSQSQSDSELSSSVTFGLESGAYFITGLGAFFIRWTSLLRLVSERVLPSLLERTRSFLHPGEAITSSEKRSHRPSFLAVRASSVNTRRG